MPRAIVLSALVGGGVSVVTAAVTALVTLKTSSWRAKVDERLAQQKDQLDRKLEYAAEKVALELLQDKDWQWRSFHVLKIHLSGFDDNELRKLLVRTGAIRSNDSNGMEVWGLADRNRESFGVTQLNISVGTREHQQQQQQQQQNQYVYPKYDYVPDPLIVGPSANDTMSVDRYIGQRLTPEDERRQQEIRQQLLHPPNQ